MANRTWQTVTKRLGAAIFCLSLLFAAGPALASSIPSFDQRIDIGANGTITVDERVTVLFDSARHGIYRDIPVKYRTEAGNPFNLRVKVVSVAGGSGADSIPYTTSKEGDYLRVKIGDPDRTVIGKQQYRIVYEVSRALLFLDDQDQLYWNVSSQQWNDLGWPQQVSAAVKLPPGVASTEAKTRCFTGLGAGAPEDCVTAKAEGTVAFSTGGTPLTVVVGWPKGAITPPSASQEALDWIADNWILSWPLIAFAAMFALWYRKGRDPKVSKAIVVEYAPPAGVSPAELGALTGSAVGKEEITATIIDLAVRGFLEITETSESGFLGNKTSYMFKLVNPDRRGLKPFEERILIGIFGSGAGAGAEVSLTELQYKFYNDSETAKKQIFDSVVASGWFPKSPAAVRAGYIGLAVAYLVLAGFLSGGFKGFGPVWFISILSPALIIAVFGYFMPARTLKGTDAYASALGFKEFLEKADKYRLQWAEKENIFEKYLPYAMVFGVVDKWAKAFEGLLNEPPNWYHGSSFAAWSPLLFVNSLNSASTAMNTVMMAAPSSKGGGGFGGGGFGGGGFGGGGGGSW